MSIAVAVTPPTSAWVPSDANVERSSRTVRSAVSESAALVSVPCSSTRPSTSVGAGAALPGGPCATIPSAVTVADPEGESRVVTVTPSMPGLASIASAAVRSSPAGTTTETGLPDPPGKCSPSTRCPSRALELVSTRSDCETPCACSWVTPAAPMRSSTVVVIQIVRGRRRMSPPSFAQTPREGTPPSAATTSGSKCGRFGQKAARPNAKRIAGSRVRAESIANTMPMEATGPSALFDFRSLSRRQRRPAMTVPPEATIGSQEPRSARKVAAHLSCSMRSASRYRET